jgi:hypothetical protein
VTAVHHLALDPQGIGGVVYHLLPLSTDGVTGMVLPPLRSARSTG